LLRPEIHDTNHWSLRFDFTIINFRGITPHFGGNCMNIGVRTSLSVKDLGAGEPSFLP